MPWTWQQYEEKSSDPKFCYQCLLTKKVRLLTKIASYKKRSPCYQKIASLTQFKSNCLQRQPVLDLATATSFMTQINSWLVSCTFFNTLILTLFLIPTLLKLFPSWQTGKKERRKNMFHNYAWLIIVVITVDVSLWKKYGKKKFSFKFSNFIIMFDLYIYFPYQILFCESIHFPQK